MASSCNREGPDCTLEKCLHREGCQALELAAQGSCWVTTLGVFKRLVDLALKRHSLVVGLAMSGLQVDSDFKGLFQPK